MRRSIGSALLPLFFLLFAASPHSNAQPVAKVCTNASIKGAYGFEISGLIGSTSGFAPFADAGGVTADGNGHFTGSDTVSAGGTITPRTANGTYTVNPDCTGTIALTDNLGNLAHLNFVIGAAGIQLIQADNGAIVAGEMNRRGACTAQDVSGAYVFATNGWYVDGNGNFQGFGDSGKLVSDGATNLTLSHTLSEGGTISATTSSGTYTVNGDCTGVATFSDPTIGVIHFNFIVVASGRQIQFIQTDAGTMIAGVAKQQFTPAGTISQLASGGAWKTTITLISTAPSPNEVRVMFWADNGTPLVIPFTVTQQGATVTGSGSSVDRTLAPGGTLLIETEAPSATTVTGWAQVYSSGPVEGSAIFRSRSNAGTDSEGTAPLDVSDASDLILPYDNTAGFVTGAAFVNLSAKDVATIVVTVRDANGTQVGSATLTLPPNGHSSFSVPTQFPSATGRRGTIELQDTSGGGVAGLGLRFNVFGSFTSVPIIVKQ